MAFSEDAYRELEDILGPDNVSKDPAVLDGYAFFSRDPRREDRFYNRPGAVVLPGSTSEVQKVIKMCNRRGIQSKASSTAYVALNALSSEDGIVLDLRRMNRILDIDEKNMMVLVEPYVTFAEVQGEVHKRGLSCHVIGAGSNCSYLASHTSVHGTSTHAISHGYSGRNVLGVEWVLPTGDILRMGAAGSGAGWFYAEGPGPSMRGIMRGAAGATGGLGVFTKLAGHLHPWPGPAKMEIKGRSPDFEAVIPPLFEYHMIEWPTWEQCAEAQYRIGEAGIAFAMHKTGGPGSHGSVVTGSNDEYYAKWEELKHIPWISYVIVTAAYTPTEHEYQVKTLNKILDDTEGSILPLGETPFFKKRDFINMIRGCFIPRAAFRCTGALGCPLNGMDSVAHSAMGLSLDKDLRKEYDEKGVLMDDGTNNMWGVPFEGSHLAIFECGHFFDPVDKDSCQGILDIVTEGMDIQINNPLACSWTVMSEQAITKTGPLLCNVQNWMRKIKGTFDPNTVSDPAGYISAEEK